MAVHKGGEARRTTAMRFVAAAGLHGASGLVTRNCIGRHRFIIDLVKQLPSIGIVSREVQKVDTGEDDQESTEQRDSVYGICGVKALE